MVLPDKDKGSEVLWGYRLALAGGWVSYSLMVG
jgi:hypothetical protein